MKPWIDTVNFAVDSGTSLQIHDAHAYYMRKVKNSYTGMPNSTKQCFNLLYLAVRGDGGYIDWKIINDTSILNDSVQRAMFGHAPLISHNWEMFFRYSILTRDNTIPLHPIRSEGFTTIGWAPDNGWSLTMWQFFQIKLSVDGFGSPKGPVNIISRFIREGAGPYCRIVITRRDEKRNVAFCFRQAQSYQYFFFSDPMEEFRDGFNRRLALRGNPEIDRNKDFDENISQEPSLREWVAVTDWDNLDSLLELLDHSYEKDKDN